MYSLEIEIPILDTDPNKTRGKHWTVTSSNNKTIKAIVKSKVSGKTPEKPLENFKISVTRFGPRALDWDNLVASFKGYIDALKYAGIIADDRWQFIKSIATDQKTSSDKKLIIRVSEVDIETNQIQQ